MAIRAWNSDDSSKAMEGTEILLLPLTLDEAHELFSRCLRSQEADTTSSEKVLNKLARLIDRRASDEAKAA